MPAEPTCGLLGYQCDQPHRGQAPAEAHPGALVAEREVLGGDRLGGLQGLRRPADQEADVGEPDLKQASAEPVLPGPEHRRKLQ
jgi:hypothetical protein